jgi:hypothetical protein
MEGSVDSLIIYQIRMKVMDKEIKTVRTFKHHKSRTTRRLYLTKSSTFLVVTMARKTIAICEYLIPREIVGLGKLSQEVYLLRGGMAIQPH